VILNLGQGGMLGGGGMGAGGGGGAGGMMLMQNRARVVNLEYENMNIFEVLAMAGGIGMYAHAEKIRIIRGNLRDPQVILINLRTVASAKKSDLRIFPNDIIYVEPGRRIVFEALGDVSGIISLVLSFTTLLLLTTTRL
jgi:polysaccharide export outer membrane protein